MGHARHDSTSRALAGKGEPTSTAGVRALSFACCEHLVIYTHLNTIQVQQVGRLNVQAGYLRAAAVITRWCCRSVD